MQRMRVVAGTLAAAGGGGKGSRDLEVVPLALSLPPRIPHC